MEKKCVQKRFMIRTKSVSIHFVGLGVRAGVMRLISQKISFRKRTNFRMRRGWEIQNRHILLESRNTIIKWLTNCAFEWSPWGLLCNLQQKINEQINKMNRISARKSSFYSRFFPHFPFVFAWKLSGVLNFRGQFLKSNEWKSRRKTLSEILQFQFMVADNFRSKCSQTRIFRAAKMMQNGGPYIPHLWNVAFVEHAWPLLAYVFFLSLSISIIHFTFNAEAFDATATDMRIPCRS